MRSARGAATAVNVRSALLDALGDGYQVNVEALTPDPWFGNLRSSVNDTVMGAVDAVGERLAVEHGDLPDWARDYGPAMF